MSTTQHAKVLILGSGPAGYTAAVYAARAMLNPILVQGLTPGGQLTITTEVENWPGDSHVQGPDLMVRMEDHARAMGAEIISDYITTLDLQSRPFTAQSDSGVTYTADAVILATGAQAKWLGLPSEEKFKGFGVSACATCDGFFYRGKEVVVIGGGNTAVEEALFLTNFATKVTLIHRRDSLRAEKIMQDRLFKHPKIQMVWNSEVTEVLGTEAPTSVSGVRTRNLITGEMADIPCHGFFVAIGHAPASELVKDQLPLHNGGYVQVEAGSTHSPVESASGLHIMTPSVSRRGALHFGRAMFGVSVLTHHTPPFNAAATRASSLSPTPCAQNTNNRPSGASQSSGSNARTGPPASGSITSTSCQVAPPSPLVLTTT
jgi:thioredoxin reductase (NADPH)